MLPAGWRRSRQRRVAQGRFSWRSLRQDSEIILLVDKGTVTTVVVGEVRNHHLGSAEHGRIEIDHKLDAALRIHGIAGHDQHVADGGSGPGHAAGGSGWVRRPSKGKRASGIDLTHNL